MPRYWFLFFDGMARQLFQLEDGVQNASAQLKADLTVRIPSTSERRNGISGLGLVGGLRPRQRLGEASSEW
jgi:hypothetical protein